MLELSISNFKFNDKLIKLVEYSSFGLSLKYSLSHVYSKRFLKTFSGRNISIKVEIQKMGAGRGSVTPLRQTEDAWNILENFSRP